MKPRNTAQKTALQRLMKNSAEKFYRGRRKLFIFKEIAGIPNCEIRKRAGISRRLLDTNQPKPTPNMQAALDKVIEHFHLNPDWVYGDADKMLLDDKSLTKAEVFKTKLNTTKKQTNCVDRFIRVYKADGLIRADLERKFGVSVRSIWDWSKSRKVNIRFADLMLRYCEAYNVSPEWLLTGEGDIRTAPDGAPLKPIKGAKLSKVAKNRFWRGWKKVRMFKNMTGMSTAEFASRSGKKVSLINDLLYSKALCPTEIRQQQLDEVAARFHLNPDWMYKHSTKILLDKSALTESELYMIKANTVEKQAACVDRFVEVCNIDRVSAEDIALIGSVHYSSVKKWLRRKKLSVTFVETILKYCDEHYVNPKWVFTGKGSMRSRGYIAPKAISETVIDLEKSKPKQKMWYVVNYTVMIPNIGWYCVPEGYQIKQARKASELEKWHPPEYETSGDYILSLYKSERAIGAYPSKKKAERALQEELKRIERSGSDANIAPWANEEVR